MHPKYTPKDIARFWAKVDRSGGPDACWLWTAGLILPGRYGKFRHARKTLGAHVVSWELAHAPVPSGLCVCHNCPGGDNPTCVNPRHLFLGTRGENNADMARKGRAASGDRNISRLRPGSHRGERNGRAKLAETDVREIRRLAAQGTPHRTLAARFGVSLGTIWHVIYRLTWKHVA